MRRKLNRRGSKRQRPLVTGGAGRFQTPGGLLKKYREVFARLFRPPRGAVAGTKLDQRTAATAAVAGMLRGLSGKRKKKSWRREGGRSGSASYVMLKSGECERECVRACVRVCARRARAEDRGTSPPWTAPRLPVVRVE